MRYSGKNQYLFRVFRSNVFARRSTVSKRRSTVGRVAFLRLFCEFFSQKSVSVDEQRRQKHCAEIIYDEIGRISEFYAELFQKGNIGVQNAHIIGVENKRAGNCDRTPESHSARKEEGIVAFGTVVAAREHDAELEHHEHMVEISVGMDMRSEHAR